jgi:hypothetical protein
MVVAVASSAGDLEAVSELLSALPAECAAAFIIVQHLDSAHETLLFEALGKRTIRPVMRAHDGAVVEQGRIYVITAKTTLTMTDGRIRVTPIPGTFCSPRSRKSVAIARSAWSSRAKGPTVPSVYKPSSKAAAPHLRSPRDLHAFPACRSMPLKPAACVSCYARMR